MKIIDSLVILNRFVIYSKVILLVKFNKLIDNLILQFSSSFSRFLARFSDSVYVLHYTSEAF